MNAESTELADNRNIDTSNAPDDNANEKRCCCCVPSKRYFLVGILFIGAISIQFLETNFNASILDIVLDRTVWEAKRAFEGIGLLRNMFIYGFLTSIIAAPIARKFGPVTTYGYALLSVGGITILNPYIARFNINLFYAVRFLEGSLVMACHVATVDILSRWSSKKERFKMVSIVISGTYVGNIITYPTCRWLATVLGWPSTFYCTGAIAVLISTVILLWFVDDPLQDKSISKNELALLTRELEDPSNEKITRVLKKILAAKSLWVLLVTKIGFECGAALSRICVPFYVQVVMGEQTNYSNIIPSVPNVVAILTLPAAGLLADYLKNSKILTATQVHKTYIATGFVLGAMCLFAISLIPKFAVDLILLVIFTILSSLGQLTMTTLPIYMAPQHSGLIAAIISYGFHIGVFITPTLMGFIVTPHSAAEWSFLMAAVGAIVLSCGIIFLLFGSGKVLQMFRVKPSYKLLSNLK